MPGKSASSCAGPSVTALTLTVSPACWSKLATSIGDWSSLASAAVMKGWVTVTLLMAMVPAVPEVLLTASTPK